MVRHLVTVADLSNEEISQLFESAANFLPWLTNATQRQPLLAGQTLATAFYENSTRTRLSFNLAAQYLGMHVVDLNVATSSVQKGETLADTLSTLAAMGVNAVALRHESDTLHASEALPICHQTNMALLNAGAGKAAHPTQALLDAFTLWHAWQGNLAGKTLAMVGDIAHSRVAASNAELLHRLGVTVHCIAPNAWQPSSAAFQHTQQFSDLKSGLENVDAVMTLRIQKERHSSNNAINVFDYQLNHETMAWAKPEAMVLHPGPMNRGVEITDALADDPQRSWITRQVSHGVAMRMALLYWALSN